MVEVLPALRQGLPGAEVLGKLLQRGGGVLRVDLRGHLPHQEGTVSKVLAGKAQGLQQLQVFQEQGAVLLGELCRNGPQEGLAHRRGVRGHEAVKIDALVGGVLVDQIDFSALALTDDVGAQHLTHHAPGSLLSFEQGLLTGKLQLFLGDGGDKGLFGLGFFRDRGGFHFRIGADRRGSRLGNDRRRRRAKGGLGLVNGLFLHIRNLRRALPLGIVSRTGHSRGGRLCERHRRALPEGLGVHVQKEIVPGIQDFSGLWRGGSRGIFHLQAVQHGVVHRVEDLLLPGKLHLGLGRMDVDIHRRHRKGHKDHAAGELPLHDLVAVALLQGRREKLGLDKAAVDKEGLHGAAAPAHKGLRDKTLYLDVPSPALDFHKALGKVPAQGGVNGGGQLPVAGGVEALHAVF